MVSFIPIFRSLEVANIRYVTVGGIATVLYGFARVTGDIDIVLDLSEGNAGAAMDVFSALGFRPRAPVPIQDFASASKRNEWISDKGMQVFSIFSPQFKLIEIDIFVREPIPFPQLWERSVLMAIDDVPIRVVGIDDLILLKEDANRPQDIEDVRVLKSIKASMP